MKKNTEKVAILFAGKILTKRELKLLKGGDRDDDDDDDDDDYNSAKARRKRCEKAWQDASERARRSGRRIKRVSGNGNGIW